MSVIGIDHGTQAIRFFILPEGIGFEIPRIKKDFSALEEIEKRIPLEKIELVALTYSMGDGINKITDIKKVKNRGVISRVAGEVKGIGTKVFDEIASSELRAIVIPGLHRGVEVLDKRFRALYSHCASAEKVSLCYDAYLKVKKKKFIVCDISSNTVTIAIKNQRFFGAIDACLGAIGIYHGFLDLEAIRKVDTKVITANMAFSRGGAIKIHSNVEEILQAKNEKARLALEAMLLSIKMEIFGFLSEVKPQAFVISGWAGVNDNIFYPLKDSLEQIAPVIKLDHFAPARGSAEIARDVLKGKKNFLGIKLDNC